jgi:hypothetical protein
MGFQVVFCYLILYYFFHFIASLYFNNAPKIIPIRLAQGIAHNGTADMRSAEGIWMTEENRISAR